MTVNLSINDLINKNYDTSKYNNLIDNGVMSLEQIKAILIIKDIQNNKILLSIKEKEQLNNYFDQLSFNVNISAEDDIIDNKEEDVIDNKEEEVIDNKDNITNNIDNKEVTDKKEEKKIDSLKLDNTDNQAELIKDPNLMTCPAPKFKKMDDSEITDEGKKIYRIKYISDQTKLKILAML